MRNGEIMVIEQRCIAIACSPKVAEQYSAMLNSKACRDIERKIIDAHLRRMDERFLDALFGR